MNYANAVKRAILAIYFALGLAAGANAEVVTLSSTGTNFLQINFTVAAQPAAHNALNIGAFTSGGPSLPAFAGTTSLFNGATLLSQAPTSYLGQRYASPGSFLSSTDPLIDYTSIANGSIVGMFTLLVTSGSVTFNTNDLFVQPFGDGGSLPGYAGQISSVVTSVAPVPLPAAAWLLLSGVGALGAITRRRGLRTSP